MTDLKKEKIICINCKKDAYWCGTKPDEDGDLHDCHQISCDHCGMQYDFVSDEAHNAETIAACRDVVRKTYAGFKK